MEIRTIESESSLVVQIRGLLDTQNASDLDKFLESRIAQGYRKFLLDCKSLESISSGGIAFLLRIQAKRKSDPGLVFVLTDLNSEVSRILRFLGLRSKLTIVSTQQEGRQYLAKIPTVRKRDVTRPLSQQIHTKVSETASVAHHPSPERIRFYYRGNAPRYTEPTRLEKESAVSRNEPVSRMEPVTLEDQKIGTSIEGKDSSDRKISVDRIDPQDPKKAVDTKDNMDSISISSNKAPLESDFGSESILQRLEERMLELKQEVKNEVKNEVKGSHRILEDRLKEEWNLSWESWKARTPVESSVGIVTPNQKVPNSQESMSLQREDVAVEEVLVCESCGTKLKVVKTGKYQCPQCRTEFLYKGRGFYSFIEKLV